MRASASGATLAPELQREEREGGRLPALHSSLPAEVGGGWVEGWGDGWALSGVDFVRLLRNCWTLIMRKEEKLLHLQTVDDIGIAPYFASRTFSITITERCLSSAISIALR